MLRKPHKRQKRARLEELANTFFCGDRQAMIGEEYTSALESRYLFDDLVSFPVVIPGRPPAFVYMLTYYIIWF